MFNYSNLSLTELINKISASRFFNLPKMLAEALRKLSPKYKIYTALLTQTGTSVPVVTILENTLGEDITWTYAGVGLYKATLPNAFTTDKTSISTGSHYNSTTGKNLSVKTKVLTTSEFTLETFSGTSNINEVLLKTLLEIKVYN